ncbi:MAG: UbiD family decarboxylase [Dehalococcoidia bacterium]|nr:UbiD family decarboxylase [Dehalococcoidia bacterium]
MSFRDLRGWLQEVENMGQLQVARGAHWDLEIGTITELVHRQKNKPAVLFDEIPDYPSGHRVLVNALGSNDRLALTWGLPAGLSTRELKEQVRRKYEGLEPLNPMLVSEGPVMENVVTDGQVDLFRFPTPKWHEHDGGRYIGTGSVDITIDPEEKWVNLGTYRVMVHDKNTLGFYMSPGKHSRIHREKWFALGKPCPVVMSLGHDPLLFLTATLQAPPGVCEYDIAGGLKGEPIEIIRGPITGLPIPAHSEIVIEGESVPAEKRVEGPFGEFTGYYGSAERPEPFIKVKRVIYRNNPIITGAPPFRPPSDCSFYYCPINAATVWDNMEKAGVPDIRGVWQHEAATNWAFTAVSIKQRYPGHARQAGLLASQVMGGGYMNRYVVVVDEDIDPSDMDDVLWAMSTRADPARSVEILHRCWSGPLDAAIPVEDKGFNSRMIIDACRPYEWMDKFAPVVATSPGLRDRVYDRFGADKLLK